MGQPLGNPFYAIATKGNRRLYLEAKGTETDGISVEVTAGEVRFACEHPGECVLGPEVGQRLRSRVQRRRRGQALLAHP